MKDIPILMRLKASRAFPFTVGLAAGAIVTAVLVAIVYVAVGLSRPLYSLGATFSAVLCMAVGVDWSRRRPRLRSVAVGLGAGALVVGVLALFFYPGHPYGWDGSEPAGAQSNLEHAVPNPFESGEFRPLTAFTADELNKMPQMRELRGLKFVPADTPSTGPDVVSVHPINDFTWSAASLSADQDGTCYVILSTHDAQDPELGRTFYGSLPRGAPCVGLAASSTTAKQPYTWP